MKRQALDNGSWFNLETSEEFEEDTYWNGVNRISRTTDSQWNHEKLYRTKSGKWILNKWSQWQGSKESWTEIDDTTAANWLVINGYESHSACSAEYSALEL